MPITIVMNHEADYFASHYKGAITDADLLNDWKPIIDSGAWITTRCICCKTREELAERAVGF